MSFSKDDIEKVNESHKRDFDGSRRKYALQVSTSEALRYRVLAQLNGHAAHANPPQAWTK